MPRLLMRFIQTLRNDHPAVFWILLLLFMLELAIPIANADVDQAQNKLFQRDFETIDSVNGSTALLDCRLSKSLNPDQIVRISWLKMPRQLLTRGRMKITTNQRINFVPNTAAEEDTFQLKIDPVLQEDAGEYRCVYKENDSFHFKIAILNVNVKPRATIHPTNEIQVEEGSSVYMFCNVSGVPYPKIRWWMLPLINFFHYPNLKLPIGQPPKIRHQQGLLLYYQQRPLWHVQNILLLPVQDALYRYKQSVFVRRGNFVISSTTRHMVGWYFCEAFNGVQPTAFAHALLSIHYAPSVSVSQRQIERALNENVTLTCRFLAFPMAEIEWSLEGVTLNHPACRPGEWQHVCAETRIENIDPRVTKPLEYALKNPLIYEAPIAFSNGEVSRNQTRFLFNLTGSAHDLSTYGRPVESSLKIQNLRTKEFGTYACRMRNIRGVAAGYIRLKRKGITELIHPEINYFEKIDSGLEDPKAVYSKSIAPRAMANYRTSTTATAANNFRFRLIVFFLPNFFHICTYLIGTTI
nr:unnamed protein product [Spirometra erinaceieuropaei]